MKNDDSIPETDENLFCVADYEENYYTNIRPGRYAIISKSVDTREMTSVDDKLVDTSMGRFRKFTPRECLRLMGFDDNFKIVVSDTASYKQAGNSIIVNVLMALLKQLDITKYGI